MNAAGAPRDAAVSMRRSRRDAAQEAQRPDPGWVMLGGRRSREGDAWPGEQEDDSVRSVTWLAAGAIATSALAIGWLASREPEPAARAFASDIDRPGIVLQGEAAKLALREARGEEAAGGNPQPPPTDDPEALSEWFQARVLERLRDDPARAADVAVAGGAPIDPEISALRAALGRDDGDVDWRYVRDVFSGRISGIPDERRAGMTLQEIDRIGDVPHLDELRREQRYDELRELGFENENMPWPSCIRSGTCRRDRSSSPPT